MMLRKLLIDGFSFSSVISALFEWKKYHVGSSPNSNISMASDLPPSQLVGDVWLTVQNDTAI